MTYLGTDSDSKSFCLTYFWWYSTRKYLRYLFFECVFWCLTFLEWREGYQLALLISTSKVNSVWKSLGMMNWDAYCFKIRCLRKGQKTSVISKIEWNCALVEVRYGAIWLKKDGFAVLVHCSNSVLLFNFPFETGNKVIPLITSSGDGVNYVPIFICDSQTVFCSWIWRDVLLEVKWFCSTFVQNYNCNSEIKTNDDDWIFRLRNTNTPSDSESRIVSNEIWK